MCEEVHRKETGRVLTGGTAPLSGVQSTGKWSKVPTSSPPSRAIARLRRGETPDGWVIDDADRLHERVEIVLRRIERASAAPCHRGRRGVEAGTSAGERSVVDLASAGEAHSHATGRARLGSASRHGIADRGVDLRRLRTMPGVARSSSSSRASARDAFRIEAVDDFAIAVRSSTP